MSLLTMIDALALNVGIRRPSNILGSRDREWAEAVEMLDATGDELARRVDWGELTRKGTVAGGEVVPLPSDFGRFTGGICVVCNGKAVRPLERAEWAYMPHDVTGQPRYFILTGDELQTWPKTTDDLTIYYQSDIWRASGASEWQSDNDASLIDEDLMAKGLIVRWRRKQGMPFEDDEAEYEAAVRDYARFNDRSRLS